MRRYQTRPVHKWPVSQSTSARASIRRQSPKGRIHHPDGHLGSIKGSVSLSRLGANRPSSPRLTPAKRRSTGPRKAMILGREESLTTRLSVFHPNGNAEGARIAHEAEHGA